MGALGSARDAALASGATPEAALEAARQLVLALFPALPHTQLREALDGIARTPAAPVSADRLRHGPGQPVTFQLTPNPDRRWHADWLCSRYPGPCLVSAGNEDGARGLAAQHFRSAEVHLFDGDPWRRRDLLRAEAGDRLPQLPYGMEAQMVGRLGRIGLNATWCGHWH